jgi:hypothetical protein
MRMTRLIVAIALTAVLGIGCGDREEKKPVSANSTPAAAPASATIKLTFPYVIPISSETPHNIGSFDRKLGGMVARKNDTGALVFGPYLELEPGKYRATFKLNAGGNPGGIVGKVDVSGFSQKRPDNPVAEAELKQAKGTQQITLDFDGTTGMKYEFRVWANGQGEITAQDIVIDRK